MPLLCRICQLVHRVLVRRDIRIPHTKVDDIFSLASQFHLQGIHDLEDIRRRTILLNSCIKGHSFLLRRNRQ